MVKLDLGIVNMIVIGYISEKGTYIVSIFTMECFYGTWKFVSCENFDDYLKGP